MRLGYREVKAGHAPLRQALSAARGARNRKSRDVRAQEQEDRERERRHRRRRAKEERDLKRALDRRFRVQVPERERPRISNACPRKLFHRLAGLAFASTGMTPVNDGGVRSIHFAFVARGFASRTGRRWRSGEGGRAALYVTRAEGLEGGEAGWWSNIADDRNELVAYTRVSEEIEKHDRANANVYVSEIISLDHTLTASQRRRVVKRICRFFDKRGLGYVAALHTPDRSGDQRNFHAHILYSLRPVRKVAEYEWEFAASKVGDINTPTGIRARREAVVRALNATLAASGSARRYTHLSNRARGLPSPQTGKLGQAATWLQRRIQEDEGRVARLTVMKSALEHIKTGFITAMKADGLGAQVAERLGEQQRYISDSRLRIGSRISRVRQAMVLRLDEPLEKILEMPALDLRLAAIAGAIARIGARRDFLGAKRLEIKRALERDVSASLRGSIEDRLHEAAAKMDRQMAGHDRARAELKNKVRARLQAAVAPPAAELASIRRQVQLTLLRHRSEISSGGADIAARLRALEYQTTDKVLLERAAKLALARERSPAQVGLAALLSTRADTKQPHATEQDRAAPAPDMAALCLAAFERLRALGATVILVGPDRYRVDDAGLPPDQREAWLHPEFSEMRLNLIRKLFDEQQSREQVSGVRPIAGTRPDLRGLTKGPREEEPPTGAPRAPRER